MQGLAAKTNSQTNSQAGLDSTEEQLQNKPGPELAEHRVAHVPCRWTLHFLGAQPCAPSSRSLPWPQHVFPVVLARTATMGNLNPWGRSGLHYLPVRYPHGVLVGRKVAVMLFSPWSDLGCTSWDNMAVRRCRDNEELLRPVLLSKKRDMELVCMRELPPPWLAHARASSS